MSRAGVSRSSPGKPNLHHTPDALDAAELGGLALTGAQCSDGPGVPVADDHAAAIAVKCQRHNATAHQLLAMKVQIAKVGFRSEICAARTCRSHHPARQGRQAKDRRLQANRKRARRVASVRRGKQNAGGTRDEPEREAFWSSSAHGGVSGDVKSPPGKGQPFAPKALEHAQAARAATNGGIITPRP